MENEVEVVVTTTTTIPTLVAVVDVIKVLKLHIIQDLLIELMQLQILLMQLQILLMKFTVTHQIQTKLINQLTLRLHPRKVHALKTWLTISSTHVRTSHR